MRFLILANPNAGSKHGKTVVEKLVTYMTREHINFKLFLTERAGDEVRLMKQILAGATSDDRVVISGGDGTLSLALNHLPADRPFSYIPAGSGNDFARAMDISRDAPIAVFKNLQRATPKEFYIMHYQSASLSGFALNNIGIGIDGAILEASERGHAKKLVNKLHLQSLTYLLTGFNQIFTQKGFPA
ncbi:MAG: acylglycerol kinase family protein, partial [Streptococcaceae bacterium]|nr:acylglycerol kinase family protein [Streptococcaceae bacterium]